MTSYWDPSVSNSPQSPFCDTQVPNVIWEGWLSAQVRGHHHHKGYRCPYERECRELVCLFHSLWMLIEGTEFKVERNWAGTVGYEVKATHSRLAAQFESQISTGDALFC